MPRAAVHEPHGRDRVHGPLSTSDRPRPGPVARAIALKLGLLLLTALIAAHARFRVIARLSAQTLPLMAWHVAAVTLLSNPEAYRTATAK